jgi:catechol 2,3-dioxygenase-like lactoylglutathione lyase family enzyme
MPKAVISSVEPQLFVADVTAACDFFTSKLGFGVTFVHGTPPSYAQVRRDGAAVNLRHVDHPVVDVTMREREQLLSVSFTVASAGEIDALFGEFQAAGVTFSQTLKSEPWGARDFVVKDPDGNRLLFAGPDR